jgi:hypothetical protein
MPDYRYFVIGGVDAPDIGGRLPVVELGPYTTLEDALTAAGDLFGRDVEEVLILCRNARRWRDRLVGEIVGVAVERWQVTGRLRGFTDGWAIHGDTRDDLLHGARVICA